MGISINTRCFPIQTRRMWVELAGITNRSEIEINDGDRLMTRGSNDGERR